MLPIFIGLLVCAVGFLIAWLGGDRDLGRDAFLFGFLILCGGIFSRVILVPYPKPGVGVVVKIGAIAFSLLVLNGVISFIETGTERTAYVVYGGIAILTGLVGYTLLQLARKSNRS